MIYTKYVWTALGCEMGEKGNVSETRISGFPALFAYRPLEASMTIAKAWLDAGYIEKVDEMIPVLYFYWRGGTAFSHMVNVLNENQIEWYLSQTGQLTAAIGEDDEMLPVEYCHVSGNCYEIIRKPRTTSEFFRLSPEELYEKEDGWRRESKLLIESNIHEKPFAVSLKQAVRKAREYIRLGCTGVEVLQCINNSYAVVCY